MNKTLVLLPNTIGFSFISVLNETQKRIINGEEVHVLGCDGSVRHCDYNITGSKFICYSCSHCNRKSLSFLNGNYSYYSFDNFIDNELKNKTFKNTEHCLENKSLKNAKYYDYDIGYAVMSTYISLTRNQDPKPDAKFKTFIKPLFYDSLLIYEAVNKAIKRINPNKIIIYNGRTHINRPVFALAKEKYKIDIDVLEVTGGYGKKPIESIIYNNNLPHSIDNNTFLINSYWNEYHEQNKTNKAKDFFEARKKGVEAADRSYVAKQKIGLLPKGFDSNKNNIAIFISSNDELVAIGKEWEWDYFGGSQINAIKEIADILKENQDYHIYLRVHPNLKHIKYKYHKQYYNLEHMYPNVTVIDAKAKISTYSLIDSCHKIISFGSSVGVEATYWGKSSILIGKSNYMNLGATYNPKNTKELLSLLLNPKLQPKSIKGSLKYGLYMLRPGEKMEHFDRNDLNKSPKIINRNLFLFHVSKPKQRNISALVNFLLFSCSRLLNNIYLKIIVPKKEI